MYSNSVQIVAIQDTLLCMDYKYSGGVGAHVNSEQS